MFTSYNRHFPLGSRVPGRNSLPSLTTDSLNTLRQHMDESNHETVNMLTQQIGTVFNLLIQNTNQSYQMLATQIGRITDFYAPAQVRNQQIPLVQNPRALQINERSNNEGNQGQQHAPQVHPVETVAQVEGFRIPPVVLVNRNQDVDVDVDVVVTDVQQNNLGGHNNTVKLF